MVWMWTFIPLQTKYLVCINRLLVPTICKVICQVKNKSSALQKRGEIYQSDMQTHALVEIKFKLYFHKSETYNTISKPGELTWILTATKRSSCDLICLSINQLHAMWCMTKTNKTYHKWNNAMATKWKTIKRQIAYKTQQGKLQTNLTKNQSCPSIATLQLFQIVGHV